MTTWDDVFESIPGDYQEAKYGASEIRNLKRAISEREELEHNFKVGTSPFHKAGLCSVAFVGTTAEIEALTGMTAGCAVVDSELNLLQIYDGTEWITQTLDHGSLSGSTDDDHPEYLRLDKVDQKIMQNVAVEDLITIDGRDLSVDGTKLDGLPSTVAYANGLSSLGVGYSFNTNYGPGSTDAYVFARATAQNQLQSVYLDAYIEGVMRDTSRGPTVSLNFLVAKGETWKVTLTNATASSSILAVRSIT